MVWAILIFTLSFAAYSIVLYHSRYRKVMSFYASVLLIFNMLMSVIYFITKNMSCVQSTAIAETFLLFSLFVYMVYHMKVEGKDLEQEDYVSLAKQYFFSGVSFVIALLTVGITYLIALGH